LSRSSFFFFWTGLRVLTSSIGHRASGGGLITILVLFFSLFRWQDSRLFSSSNVPPLVFSDVFDVSGLSLRLPLFPFLLPDAIGADSSTCHCLQQDNVFCCFCGFSSPARACFQFPCRLHFFFVWFCASQIVRPSIPYFLLPLL